jgi:hypothetical protein
MDTSTAVVRRLLRVVQPWEHYSSNDANPSTDREIMYLNREAMMDDVGNITSNSDVLDDDAVGATISLWHTMAFMMGFFFLILVTLVLKDGVFRYCGIECCEGVIPHSSQHPIPRLENEAGLTPEEIKEKRLEKQRIERRLWYAYYLKPYTTVLTAEHFMTDTKQDTRDIEEGLANDGQSAAADGKETIDMDASQNPTSSSPDELLDEALEPSSGVMWVVDSDDPAPPSTTDKTPNKESISIPDNASTNNAMLCQPVQVGSMVPSEDEGEYPTKSMTIWDAHDTTFRKVEANCSICILDYEEGDTIVRSGADEEEEYCIHVFHMECMLQWLSHGRKRCPICRRWFVPAIRIKEQMKNAHVVTQGSLHHLYDSRTMQDVVSLSGETESEMSRSFHTDDTTHDVELAT